MNRSTPGLPVHHQLPEFTQIHVHRVNDPIQPSHPVSSPSLPALNHLFQWVKSSHEVAKVLAFQLQHHFFQRYPRADLFQNGLVGSPCSPRDSQKSSPTPQFKSINSLVLNFLYIQLFVTPWTAARQASLSITNSRSSLRLTSIESMIPSSHLILCCPLLLLPPIPPSIKVFSNESTLRMRWPKHYYKWTFTSLWFFKQRFSFSNLLYSKNTVIHITNKIFVNQLFMLSIRFPVNRRLLVVRFWGSQSYMYIFDLTEGDDPFTVQGSTVHQMCLMNFPLSKQTNSKSNCLKQNSSQSNKYSA